MSSNNIPDKWHVDENGNSLQFRGFDLVVRLADSEREIRFIVYDASPIKRIAFAAHSIKWSDGTVASLKEQELIGKAISIAFKQQGFKVDVSFQGS